MNFKFVSFVLLICSSWTIYVGGLKCFECLGVNSGPCFHPEAGKVSITNCDRPGFVCYKTISSSHENKVVLRGCGSAGEIDRQCVQLRAVVSDAGCFTCRDDLCNSSNIISPVNLVLLILSLLMIFKSF